MFTYWENYLNDNGLVSTTPIEKSYDTKQVEGVWYEGDTIVFRSSVKKEASIWTIGVLMTVDKINGRLQNGCKDYRFK